MRAAAAAWDQLAAQLASAATAYQSVIDELTGQWLGPSSASMAAAAAPYVAWMHTTAGHAEHAATQAKAAAAAYDTAYTATVPPPVIAANRTQLASLIATNIFGQNTPAIAAAEAHYGQMWSQDAAAMFGYAGNSASASALSPFASPKTNTNPAGLAGQSGTLAQPAAASAGNHAMSAVPQALQGLAAPAQAAPGGIAGLSAGLEALTLPVTALSTLVSTASLPTLANAPASFTSVGFSAASIATARRTLAVNADRDFDQGIGPFYGEGPGAEMLPQWVTGDVGSPAEPPAPPPLSAGMGQAGLVGGVSVPQSWTQAAPALRSAVTALPTAGPVAGTASAALAGTSGNTFGDMALAGMAGRALGTTMNLGRRQGGDETAAGKNAEAPRSRGYAAGTVAELREITELLGKLVELRDSGALDAAEFAEQKRRLLGDY
jgi:PPE-repeat protein